MAALAASAGQQGDQHDLSSITSSSLNTTVITKLEVSDRCVLTHLVGGALLENVPIFSTN